MKESSSGGGDETEAGGRHVKSNSCKKNRWISGLRTHNGCNGITKESSSGGGDETEAGGRHVKSNSCKKNRPIGTRPR